MKEAFEQTWRAVSEALLEEMKQWQTMHPKAPFQELEQAMHTRMSRLEASVLQEAAQARPTSDWSHAEDARPSPLPGLWNAPAGTRQAHPALAGIRWAGRHPREKLRRLPDLWGRAFPPSMRSYSSCQAA